MLVNKASPRGSKMTVHKTNEKRKPSGLRHTDALTASKAQIVSKMNQKIKSIFKDTVSTQVKKMDKPETKRENSMPTWNRN